MPEMRKRKTVTNTLACISREGCLNSLHPNIDFECEIRKNGSI
jgi:hypothetical protein